MQWFGKNVVFIAGFGGIGQETCKALMTKDIKNLVILDIAKNTAAAAKLKAINEKVKLRFWTYDVTMDRKSMRKIFKEVIKKIGTIDVLIYGAGIFNEHEMELCVEINLTGLIKTTGVAIDFLDKRQGGRGGLLVTIGSVSGLNAFPATPIYSATKAAVISFTTSIAELEPLTGISAITICPGLTRTKLFGEMFSFKDLYPQLSEILAVSPMQSAEECGKNFVAAIEQNINGAIWILDMGKMETTELKSYWQPPAIPEIN